MITHNYTIVNADTDSISFCKEGHVPFSKEEQDALLKEINSLMPELIEWDHDGVYDSVLVVKSKNYALKQGEKVKIKGSALKASMKETALKEYIKRSVNALLNGEENRLVGIYNEYIFEIFNIKDIGRWCSKKTLTANVLEAKRLNEQKVLNAISGKNFQEGDKFWVYFTEDESLKLKEDFNNDHDKWRLVEKLYKTSQVFENVVAPDLFINYKLKKNRMKVEELLK